ncbi:MAG TPA: MrpF/PhaF family protein [Nocardioides sp.]|jgi:multicomponent Na+:H+ antiporter subunit F|nr:MrpF/PhaF family protein [Nocardioides sp.]
MTPTLDPTLGWVVVVLLVAAAGPCLVAVCRGTPDERLVALQCVSVVVTLALVVLSVGLHRPSYLDVPLVLALVSLAGSLVFARFFGRAL